MLHWLVLFIKRDKKLLSRKFHKNLNLLRDQPCLQIFVQPEQDMDTWNCHFFERPQFQESSWSDFYIFSLANERRLHKKRLEWTKRLHKGRLEWNKRLHKRRLEWTKRLQHLDTFCFLQQTIIEVTLIEGGRINTLNERQFPKESPQWTKT